MLDERKASILRAVVEEYIQTAQPVGSGHVVRAPGVQVSLGHRAQRHGVPRAGGLPAPAAHQRRADPHREGLPVLRRRARPRRRSTRLGAQQVRSFFDAGPRRDRADAARHHPPARPTSPSYAAVVVGPAPDRGHGALGAAGRPHGAVGLLVVGAVQRRRREAHRSSLPARRPRDDERASPRPPPTSPARLVGALAHGAAGAARHRAIAADRPRCASWPPRSPAGPTDGEDPTTSSSAATARMAGAFDAVETVRSVLGILEQQLVVVTLLRDVLDRGLQVAIGTETGMEPLAECALVVAPVPGRRRAGRHDRRARPDPDELPAGAGRGGRVSQRLGQPAERGLSVADYYELLGVPARRRHRRDQAGLPAAGPRAAPRRQPATPRPRRSSRRWPRPTRC